MRAVPVVPLVIVAVVAAEPAAETQAALPVITRVKAEVAVNNPREPKAMIMRACLLHLLPRATNDPRCFRELAPAQDRSLLVVEEAGAGAGPKILQVTRSQDRVLPVVDHWVGAQSPQLLQSLHVVVMPTTTRRHQVRLQCYLGRLLLH